MRGRRTFLKLAPAWAVPAAATMLSGADGGNPHSILGAWKTVHSLPFPPGSFRELLTFSKGGVMLETNSFLHANSNLDFSAFRLPNVVNASDGMGNWERVEGGQVRAIFRKLLFDGLRNNFGDLRVTGMITASGTKLSADWQIDVVDLSGTILFPFGAATSEGIRIE